MNSMIKKQPEGYYKLMEGGNAQLSTVFAFLRFGPFPDSYIEFLADRSRMEFYGNVANLYKNDEWVTIEIDDYQFPGLPVFTTKTEGLLKILKEWQRLEKLEPDRIELTLDNNELAIAGYWEK